MQTQNIRHRKAAQNHTLSRGGPAAYRVEKANIFYSLEQCAKLLASRKYQQKLLIGRRLDEVKLRHSAKADTKLTRER
jgi:hypothetical protein